jgi:hypothetical protein
METKFHELCMQIRELDPEAEMVVPCKFYPRCRPPAGSACRFSHVPNDVRDAFFVLQDLASAEKTAHEAALSVHRQTLHRVHAELRSSLTTRKLCVVVSYSFQHRMHGTEYVFPPRAFFGSGDFADGARRYVDDIQARFPGTVVCAMRLASVSSAGTADGGHPVRESFRIPSFFE